MGGLEEYLTVSWVQEMEIVVQMISVLTAINRPGHWAQDCASANPCNFSLNFGIGRTLARDRAWVRCASSLKQVCKASKLQPIKIMHAF